MKRALRYPSRWAGRGRTLIIMAALTGLGACNTLYGAREGTMEYPGSAAGPNAVPMYVVRNKDTVDSVAQRYGVSSQSIIDRNNMSPPYALRAGQTIAVPGAKYVPPTELDPEAPASAPTQAAASPGGPVKKQELAPPPGQQASAASPPPPEHARPAGEPTPLSPAATAPPPGPTPRFVWPLHGKIITPYGNAGGQKSDGIDIATTNGAPVKAADGGKVVYAGDGVPKLGNLVLVEHSAGYITAYGNNDALLVKKGDEVKKGQTIARAGSSGGVDSPRLHFEIRRGGSQTIDPVSMLPSQ